MSSDAGFELLRELERAIVNYSDALKHRDQRNLGSKVLSLSSDIGWQEKIQLALRLVRSVLNRESNDGKQVMRELACQNLLDITPWEASSRERAILSDINSEMQCAFHTAFTHYMALP